MPPTPDPNQELAAIEGERILRQILTERHTDSMPLPHLEASSESFKLWEEFVETAFDAIRSLFPGGTDLPIGDGAVFLVQAALVVLLILVIYYIVRALLRISLRSAREEANLRESDMSLESRSSGEDLERALRAKDWSRAMRLRWKLFLLRTRLSESVTPLEFFAGAGREAFAPPVTDQYGIMFGPTSLSVQRGETIYRAFDRGLLPLETPPGENESSEPGAA